VCWAYDEPAEFHSAASEFLAEGLRQGLRVRYIADGDTEALWDDLRDLDTTNPSAVQVQSLGDAASAVMEPRGQVRAMAAATEEALATGFPGLRVAVAATPLVRTPRQLDAVARYEHLVDRYMNNHPLSVLCGFNKAELGEEPIAQLAALHPFVNEGAPLFRLYASTYAAASLSGELDATTCSLFPMALRRADLRPTAGELVIDASELAFIDHRCLLSLADHVRRWDATAVLLGDLPSAAKLIDFLDLREVRVEVPP
jgi:anti-anti-sigma regulatory factor